MGCSMGLCQHLRDIWSQFFRAEEEQELTDYVRYLDYKFFGIRKKHFTNYVKPIEDDPVLLILDSHMPHCSLDAVSFCTEHCITLRGTRWCSWLRHCTTSWTAVGSIPDGVTEIFHWQYSHWLHYGPEVESASDRKEYEEYFKGGKGGQCIGWTTLPPSCADCHDIWES